METRQADSIHKPMVLFLACKVLIRLGTLTDKRIKEIVDTAEVLHRCPRLWESCKEDVIELIKWVRKNKTKKRKILSLDQTVLDSFFEGNL